MIAKKDIVIAKLVFIGDKRELLSIHQRASQQVYMHKIECEFTDVVDKVEAKENVETSAETPEKPKAKKKSRFCGKNKNDKKKS